jgi:hypothetical protein
MPLTLDEIVEHEERLRQEIVERECLLAAFKVLHGYAANGQSPKSMELGSLVSALAPAAPAIPLQEPAGTPVLDPMNPPASAPVTRYIHPDLAVFGSQSGSNGKIVSWAIQRMTEDYSLRDIAALLEREGRPMRSSEISVVLTRLKSRGGIEEVKPGSGPIPAVYRKPENATSPETETADQTDGAAPPVESSIAA